MDTPAPSLAGQSPGPPKSRRGAAAGGSRKKIALVMHGFSGGGMERSMLRLASGFLARGHVVEFVVKKRHGELADQIPDGIAVHEIGHDLSFPPKNRATTKLQKLIRRTKKQIRRARRGVRNVPLRNQLLRAEPLSWRLFVTPDVKALRSLDRLESLPGLVNYLKRERPNALLAAEPHYNAMAVLARRVASLPARVVLSERVQPSMRERRWGPWRHPYLKDFLRRVYLASDAIVAVSDGVADDLAICSGIPRDRITTVYNPIVGPDIAMLAQETVPESFFDPGMPPVILAVGRLDPQKDYPTLLRAFARLRERREARLVILGATHRLRTAYRQEIVDLAAELGVGDDLVLAGYRDNPFAYMARARVFVLSSTHEGLPGVLIQALACGCPSVSTDCPSGPREILDDGRYGALVPVGDDAALAVAIGETLDNPIESSVLKARADAFSVDHAVDSYLRLLLMPGAKAEPVIVRHGGA
jgi:glycosyltransferase involved in cell wall biosynthesis